MSGNTPDRLPNIEKDVDKRNVIDYLTRLLMCSVTERYALLFRLGFHQSQIEYSELNGSPGALANKLINDLPAYTTINTSTESYVQSIYKRIMNEPLSSGIPKPDIQTKPD